MASPASVSRGWTGTFAALEALAAKAGKQAQLQAAEKADIGFTWTNLVNTVANDVPPALTRAREHASRMMSAVR